MFSNTGWAILYACEHQYSRSVITLCCFFLAIPNAGINNNASRKTDLNNTFFIYRIVIGLGLIRKDSENRGHDKMN